MSNKIPTQCENIFYFMTRNYTYEEGVALSYAEVKRAALEPSRRGVRTRRARVIYLSSLSILSSVF